MLTNLEPGGPSPPLPHQAKARTWAVLQSYVEHAWYLDMQGLHPEHAALLKGSAECMESMDSAVQCLVGHAKGWQVRKAMPRAKGYAKGTWPLPSACSAAHGTWPRATELAQQCHAPHRLLINSALLMPPMEGDTHTYARPHTHTHTHRGQPHASQNCSSWDPRPLCCP